MILRMTSTNPDGIVLSAEEVEVKDRQEASAYLAYELSSTSSDMFTHNALKEWFTSGTISNISEDVNDTSFWNVQLYDN
jgi:hypothetical protein